MSENEKNREIIAFKFKDGEILKSSLDSILSPSPSVKIQIMGRKVCLRCKGKKIARHCQQTEFFKRI